MTDLKALLAETTPVAWKYRWKIDGEFVNWRYSDASNAHPSLDGFEEIPLYDRPAPDLAAEVVRLRKALEEIDGMGHDAPMTFAGSYGEWYSRRANLMQGIARAALEGRER